MAEARSPFETADVPRVAIVNIEPHQSEAINQLALKGCAWNLIYKLRGPVHKSMLLSGFDGRGDVAAAIAKPREEILARSITEWSTFMEKPITEKTVIFSPFFSALYAEQPCLGIYDGDMLEPCFSGHHQLTAPMYKPHSGEDAQEALIGAIVLPADAPSLMTSSIEDALEGKQRIRRFLPRMPRKQSFTA